MAQSTIGLIVLAIVLVLYMIPQIPLSVTTIFAMIAMAVTGIISYADVFSGFANSATLLVAGMMVIGHACFTSGLAEWFGGLLFKFVGANEKLFVIMILVIASLLAVVVNGALVVAMLMPIIDSIVYQSKGTITRKHCYFPLGLASTLGNNLTTISATSMITASGLVAAAGYGQMSLFAPTVLNLPALLVVIILYAIFGYKLQQRWFDFEEQPYEMPEEQFEIKTFSKCKMVITAVVLIGVVTGLLAGMNYGACALCGVVILIFSGCIDESTAYRCISWPTIIIVAGSMGFSKGLEASGAGEIIANTIIELSGPVGQSGLGICMILFLAGSLLSNLMSDNASVAILVPIAIALGRKMGGDVMPLVLAAASGIKVAVATPISVVTMTMVETAGYRFKDYLRMGGLVNIVAMVVTGLVIKFVYFM